MRLRVEAIVVVVVGVATLAGACATVRSSQRHPTGDANPSALRSGDCQMIAATDRPAALARAARLFTSSARALAKVHTQHCPQTGVVFCAAIEQEIAKLTAMADSARARCRAASPIDEVARCEGPARRRVMVITPAIVAD